MMKSLTRLMVATLLTTSACGSSGGASSSGTAGTSGAAGTTGGAGTGASAGTTGAAGTGSSSNGGSAKADSIAYTSGWGCVVLAGNKLGCWNTDVANTSIPVIPGVSAKAVSIYGSTALVALTDGTAEYVALGDNNKLTPVPGFTNVVSVAQYNQGGVLLLADGTVQYYQNNAWMPLTGFVDVAQLAVGSRGWFAVQKDGTLLYTGFPNEAPKAKLTGVKQVSVRVLTAALMTDGTVETDLDKATPTAVAGLTGATMVAAGGEASCALMGDHTVKCWGSNATQEFLTSAPDFDTHPPTTITGVVNAAAIAVGDHSAIALETSGDVWSWGPTLTTIAHP
jgi:alpha-tubulin suppressor-like RCC1 family protein